MSNELTPWIERAEASGLMRPEDAARVRFELWELLALKADVLSLGDSSIREEQAEELFRSICYTVSLALDAANPGEAGSLLVKKPLRALYREGARRIEERVKRARVSYDHALASALPFENLAYRDTLKNIGGFFAAYRPGLFAHDIPCMIDYPLFRPADGLGVDFIEAYLAEWLTENGFLRAFDFGRITRLLDAHLADAREQVVNLFDPVAVNALGLRLLGADPETLDVPPDGAARIFDVLQDLPEGERTARLTGAAEGLSGFWGADAALRALLRQAAVDLAARIGELPPEAADGVFTSFAGSFPPAESTTGTDP